MWTVKALAARTGLSVRALHHYDRLGLVRPAGHSPAGYRLYSEAELVRLHQLLFYRAMGLELKAIGVLLDGGAEPVEVLQRHLASMKAKSEELLGLIQTCEASIAALIQGEAMNSEHFAHLHEPNEALWAKEAQARWGTTMAWRQSQERLRAKGAGGPEFMKEAWGGLLERFAEAQREGPPDGPLASSAAAAQHAFLNEHCYDCSLDLLRSLGESYVEDPRFLATYEAKAAGLATFVREALQAWVEREEAALKG